MDGSEQRQLLNRLSVQLASHFNSFISAAPPAPSAAPSCLDTNRSRGARGGGQGGELRKRLEEEEEESFEPTDR